MQRRVIQTRTNIGLAVDPQIDGVDRLATGQLVPHGVNKVRPTFEHLHPPALEQRKVGRTENPAPAERYLGHPSKASACRTNPGSGFVRSGHRQQASSLRLNQAPCMRRCSWRACVITSNGYAAENEATSAVRNY